MYFNTNLLVNFTPIVATISAFVIAITIIIRGIRIRWPITVNCWFCNGYTKLYRAESDWWLCPLCEQYNGFLKDGDYKYDIPEQRKRSLNSAKLYSTSFKRERDGLQGPRKNGLCKRCNDNEELKIIELRSIDPTKWRESEIESFKQNLDKKFPLCKKCNSFVRKVLHKQSLWLTQYKMLLFKQKSLKIITNNGTKLEKLCRIFLTLLSSTILYYPTNHVLSIIGALIQLIVVIQVPLSRRNADLFLFLLWVIIGTIMPLSNERLLKLKLTLGSFTLDYITGYHIISILSIIIGFMNIPSKNTTKSNSNVSFKKLETPLSNIDLMNTMPSPTAECNNKSNRSPSLARPSPVNITHLLTDSTSSESISQFQSRMSPNLRICDSQRSSSNLFTKQNQIEISTKHSPVQSNDRYTLNDSLKSLNNLSLNTNQHKQSSKSSKVFETRTYGTSSPELFRKNYKTSGKFILAPPKLKSATQTSWVAGGYWQMGMDTPALSRSSSQSSGFGSTGSNFGPSREQSVVNDVDRYSVMSDTTPYCNQRASMSPVTSFCHHGSTQVPELGCMRSPNIVIPCHQSQVYCHNCHINDQCIQHRSMNGIPRNAEISCISYSPSILTSPIWLPALVCGSIVFNMIVFCTILLR